MYATALGRFPAMMIEVMASRTLLLAWSPAGYYEDLFNAGHIDGSKSCSGIQFRTGRLSHPTTQAEPGQCDGLAC